MIVFTLLFIIFVLFITYYKWAYTYWKKKGVDHLEPTIPFGNFESPLTRTKSFAIFIKDYYNVMKKKGARHAGIYTYARPVYIPIDLEYLKNVMAKDFSHFVDRGTFHNEKYDPLSGHLFNIGGVKWRNLRVKLSPTFTSGKMKMMFATLVECGKIFKSVMDKQIDEGAAIDIKDVLGRFTTDIIGSVAFGLDCNSSTEEDSSFRKYGKAIFERTRIQTLLSSVAFNFPRISKALGWTSTPKDVTKFFMEIVTKTVAYREVNNYTRNDFLQILIDLKNNKLEGEGDSGETHQHDGKSLTIEEVAAQCFVFFIAGFETSSTAMTFSLFEMCRNPEIQEKVRQEVDQVLKKYNGNITYEALLEMKYMEQVINEALRMYPPLPLLTRRCIKDYQVPNTEVVIEKGTMVFIPVLGYHRDGEYFPDPDKFDPERFNEENKKNIPPYAFLPFGEGPRVCIGLRFGMMQTKMGLTILLRNYRFTLHEKTVQPIKMSPTAFISTVEGGIWLQGKHLKKDL